jgi:hypothetical protein
MPALAAKFAVAVAAAVVAWAGIEAVRLRPVATTAPSRTAAEAGSNRSNEVPRLAPGVVKKSEPKESPTDGAEGTGFVEIP